ncbi:hypothetical protein Syun_012498 [Stephania yunnanensis]|uniref:Uncharacterized protein n=1 Tax=Stephania yunnanensis TaxID=152371 RepID=A0AAP0JZI4_9MAGN
MARDDAGSVGLEPGDADPGGSGLCGAGAVTAKGIGAGLRRAALVRRACGRRSQTARTALSASADGGGIGRLRAGGRRSGWIWRVRRWWLLSVVLAVGGCWWLLAVAGSGDGRTRGYCWTGRPPGGGDGGWCPTVKAQRRGRERDT